MASDRAEGPRVMRTAGGVPQMAGQAPPNWDIYLENA